MKSRNPDLFPAKVRATPPEPTSSKRDGPPHPKPRQWTLHNNQLTCNQVAPAHLVENKMITDVYTRLKKVKGGYKELKGTKRFRQVCHHQG